MNLAAQADEYMQARVALEHFSGAVCIARAGEVLFSQGYGLANREHDVPNTPHTKFRLASITKPFTATAILLLQQEGKLHVNDVIRAHLLDCPQTWHEVTIHHLLSHTSGVPNVYTDAPETWATSALPKTVPELIGDFRDRPLDFAPGRRRSGSNSGYVLLGAIIEQVSGRSYEQFLREQIFDPLGMHDSGYDRHSLILPHRAAGYATRDGAFFNVGYIDMLIAYAAGGLYSTVGDLCLWDEALYAERLVAQPLLDMMFTPTPIAEPPYTSNYGYGGGIDSQFGRRCVAHNGRIFGFSANLTRFLDERVLIVVLSNLETSFVPAIARDLAAIVFGEPFTSEGG